MGKLILSEEEKMDIMKNITYICIVELNKRGL